MFDTKTRLDATEPPQHAPRQPEPQPDALHPADASDELVAILCRIDQLEAQAAAALAKMNESAKWRRKGYTSATAFLRHRAGFAAGRAMQLVTRSNALASMPITSARFARGDLSVDQVDVLVGGYNFNAEAFAADEAMLVDLATQLPFVRELWQLLEYWKQRIDPELVEECQDMLNSLRGIRLRRDGGIGRINGAVGEAEFDTLLNVLDPGPPAPEDHRSLAQRRADRLMELASASMDRPQLLVHVSLDKLTRSEVAAGVRATNDPFVDNPVAETEYGTVLTPEGVSRIACDASVCRVVFGPDGQPLEVGRPFRLFPEPLHDGPSSLATATAASQAATGRRDGATPTTSFTGPAAARHASTTASCCADSTTPWFTRSDGPSPERATTSQSTTTSAGRTPPRARRPSRPRLELPSGVRSRWRQAHITAATERGGAVEKLTSQNGIKQNDHTKNELPL